ncbi:hypothetical protein KC19_VG123700 [Ceratodon purpureus]|uniref:Secreted protein n=1 Tax=Ceratodon purpureus TaxID=3225 RepID=A0A8T0HQC5_CERPU|nr:hypothetical protein KC19_VG123700 [Ceratodon purpureus]
MLAGRPVSILCLFNCKSVASLSPSPANCSNVWGTLSSSNGPYSLVSKSMGGDNGGEVGPNKGGGEYVPRN